MVRIRRLEDRGVRRRDGARDALAIAAADAPRSGNVINGLRAVSLGAASPGAQGPLNRWRL
jgi:hypothetical protein